MQTSVPVIEDFDGFNKHLSGFIKRNDKIALLLDFDGTLAPICSHPNAAALEPESEQSLFKLNSHPNVLLAIISGRGVTDAKNRVGLDNITYAGNHGLEIDYSDGSKYLHEIPDDFKDKFIQLVDELEKYAPKGAWVENKIASLTFHYRQVAQELHDQLAKDVMTKIRSYGFLANLAHCSIEAKPPVQWNKGEAALLILQKEFGTDWHSYVKAIFAGDDTTDEDAMKALKSKGISFRISESPNVETHADYRLPNTKTMSMLLKWIEQMLY